VSAPEPAEIYERTQAEGRRRLSRSPLELAATSFVGGGDVVFGIIALGVVGHHYGHVAGALAFGIAFVFIVVGRSELFTENFLVPIAGLDSSDRGSWLKLVELWTLSPVLNLIGGFTAILIATTHGVLPDGTGSYLIEVARHIDENSLLSNFMSALLAGALITFMTWLVEGAESMGTRILCGWVAGALLALGAFNHVIVVTLEWFFALRYGGDLGWGDMATNFFVAASGNMVGGLVFVTLTRSEQARGSRKGSS
jgi:formate/nitrite transporter FocA (FNT family)